MLMALGLHGIVEFRGFVYHMTCKSNFVEKTKKFKNSQTLRKPYVRNFESHTVTNVLKCRKSKTLRLRQLLRLRRLIG